MAIETATRAGGVSLARGENILCSVSGNGSSSHSTDLIENVDQLLRSVNAKLGDVDLFAVACGPGSFTGLRIGLATVKSFAVCVGRKCAGVSTLAAIAHAAGTSERTVALLPAGRGEVFAQMLAVRDGEVKTLDSAAHLAPNALLEKYGGLRDLTWAGEGAHLHLETLRTWAKTHDIAFHGEGNYSVTTREGWIVAPRCEQLAVSVAALALTEYRSGRVISPEDLQATYVRASDAEINERWQKQTSQPPASI